MIDGLFIGVIEDIRRNTNNNNNTVSVSGTDIKGLLKRREIIPQTFSGIQGTAGFEVVAGYTDYCIKQYWRLNIGANAMPNRRFDFITISADKNIGNPSDFYKSRFDKLSDVTSELAHGANVVITVTPQIEQGTILLDVANPDMRTVSSDRPLIISIDRQTALELEFLQETGNYHNVFYTTRSGAQFADEALTMLYLRDGESESVGINRFEEHINVSVNTPVAGQEYIEMRRQAVHTMTNYEEINTLNGKLNFTHLKFNEDYNAGDFVTVQNLDWGVETDIQITSVEIADDGNGGRTESVILGTGEKGYIKTLTTEIKNI